MTNTLLKKWCSFSVPDSWPCVHLRTILPNLHQWRSFKVCHELDILFHKHKWRNYAFKKTSIFDTMVLPSSEFSDKNGSMSTGLFILVLGIIGMIVSVRDCMVHTFYNIAENHLLNLFRRAKHINYRVLKEVFIGKKISAPAGQVSCHAIF